MHKSQQLTSAMNLTGRSPLRSKATIEVQWPSGEIGRVSSIHKAIHELRVCNLPALGLLNALNEEHIDWILRIGLERQLRANTVIVRENEPIASMFIVLEGLFGVSVSSIPDSEIARLGPGEIIGEISFLENTVPSASVTAVERSLVLEIPWAFLAERLKNQPSFGAQFYRALAILDSRRLRHTVNRLRGATPSKVDAASGNGKTSRVLISAIDCFKSFLLQADGEAMKNHGQVPEAITLTAQQTFLDFCRLINATVGDSSIEEPLVKAELGARLQHEILPFVLLTKTTERFYSKPRGYAGDFHTIEMIYRNRATGTGRIGPLLDLCFLSAPPATAVRNRRALLVKEIIKTVQAKDGVTRVTSLACGPAREVFDVYRGLGDCGRLEASLVDIDPQALTYVAHRRNTAKLQNRMNLINANLVYLALGRQKLELEEQDLIYSIGLIDYFNDKFVVKLLDWIHRRLRPGGKVIMGNFHPNNYCKGIMDHVLEWRLIHRSEEDMHRLFASSAFGRGCSRIQFENERVNLFAESIKE